MKIQEKLEVLEKMQNDWQECIEKPELAFTKQCDRGFCFWIHFNGYNLVLVDEIRKDLDPPLKGLKISWYANFRDIGKNALLPRLLHLKRTIARLEKQLKTEQNGII